MPQKKNNDQVEVVRNEKANQSTTGGSGEGRIQDGVYIEEGVRLTNGVEIVVEVIVDKDELPASMSSLVHEGNLEGVLMAQLTPSTRRLLDMVGATRRDLREVISDVVQRGVELADK